jgi:hypothetical protein
MHVMQATPRDPWRSNSHPMRTAASTCVLCALSALAAACTASAEDVRPPSDQLYFPSGVAVAPDDSVLFVANANSELRYDSGSITVIDLHAVEAAIAAWTSPGKDPGSCAEDLDHRETLNCDEAQFIKPEAGVRIGNFATDIAIQDFTKVAGKLRLFVPSRGDPSIAWADYDGASLRCTTQPGGFGLCDDAHRLTSVNNDPTAIVVPDEPFGVFADATNEFAIVTHQTNGAVTLIDSPAGGAAQIADTKYNIFATDITTGLRGATGVSGRKAPGGDIIYVGSRTEDRIQTFTVGRPVTAEPSPPYLLTNDFFFLDSVGTNPGVGGSVDTRGMAFAPDGNRLYLTNRRPPSVQVFDTSIDPQEGVPRNVAAGASDICREASTLAVVSDTDSLGAVTRERVYVTCFQDGQVYVIDPTGQSQVEDIFSVGRGPYAIAASNGALNKRLFISNSLEDTISVVDIDPLSLNRNRVVLRIGTPKAP